MTLTMVALDVHLPSPIQSYLLPFCLSCAISTSLLLFISLGLGQLHAAALYMHNGKDGHGRAVDSQGSRCECEESCKAERQGVGDLVWAWMQREATGWSLFLPGAAKIVVVGGLVAYSDPITCL